jgi:tetratricopeptide (TPR) repeat protein
MLDEELKASEALKEEMTKLQSIAQKCEDLKASIDFLTESNAALTEELKESESLKEEMARLQTFIQTPVRATPPKKTRNNIIVTASPPDKAAGEAPPSPTSPNGVEFVPQPLTPPKLTKKQANVSSHDTMEKTSLPGENLRFHQEAEGINSQGNELMHKEKFSEALEQFTTALKLSPDGPNSHIYFSNRAAAYSHLGQYADAAEDCLKSIELNNTYEEAYSRYSMCLFYLGDVKGSVAAQKKSFDLARNAYCSDLNTITEEGSC